MQSVQVIADQRDPNPVQLFAIGMDASFTAIAGSIQSTWWLPSPLRGSCAMTSAPNFCPPSREAEAVEAPFLARLRQGSARVSQQRDRGRCS